MLAGFTHQAVNQAADHRIAAPTVPTTSTEGGLAIHSQRAFTHSAPSSPVGDHHVGNTLLAQRMGGVDNIFISAACNTAQISVRDGSVSPRRRF